MLKEATLDIVPFFVSFDMSSIWLVVANACFGSQYRYKFYSDIGQAFS